MITRVEIIAEARTWVKTPYKHLGRERGRGVDCAGLIIGVAHALGLSGFDIIDYGPMPVPSRMQQIMDDNLDRLERGEEKPGDIPWMRDLRRGGLPRHVGIMTDIATLIHAHSQAAVEGMSRLGWCVEQRFLPEYKDRVVRYYRYRGIIDYE